MGLSAMRVYYFVDAVQCECRAKKCGVILIAHTELDAVYIIGQDRCHGRRRLNKEEQGIAPPTGTSCFKTRYGYICSIKMTVSG